MPASKSPRPRRISKAAGARAAAEAHRRLLAGQLQRGRRLRDADRAQAALGRALLLSSADRQALDAKITALELQLQAPA